MLETRKVFIDTQYFVQTGLYFDNPALKAFRELCESGEMFHITTSVVIREVESHINLSVKEALSAMQTFKRKARILSSLNDEHIRSFFAEISEEEVYKKANSVFSKFIEDCHTKCITAINVNTEDILSLYFDKKPPFGDKKKSEFPDAFSLFSLKTYLDKDEKIYVVSEDPDMKSFCDNDSQLKSINSLAKVLDLYNEHTNKITVEVKQYFASNEFLIKEKTKDYLERCDVYNSSRDEDFEVWGLEVIDIENIDASVLSISDEEIQVAFDVMVQFEVNVANLDTYLGIDGRLNTFELDSGIITATKTYLVKVCLSYEFISYEFIKNRFIDFTQTDFYIDNVSNGIGIDVQAR